MRLRRFHFRWNSADVCQRLPLVFYFSLRAQRTANDEERKTDRGIGHWALGIGHWALGIGHWGVDNELQFWVEWTRKKASEAQLSSIFHFSFFIIH
jgi:hypothetical protein